MVTTIPRITRDFIKMIKIKAEEGVYRLDVNGILIDVFPYVFPPQSVFSESSYTIYDQFGNLARQEVLDIGTGTGIQAIQACLAGALTVDAVDIYGGAVECAKHNVKLNGLNSKINVWQSDLFSNIPKKEYNLIIANLPILEADEADLRFHSLFDPKFAYHEKLFNESPKYLSDNGRIMLCHANLHERSTFDRLEQIAKKNGFDYTVNKKIRSLGYEWRNYVFQ